MPVDLSTIALSFTIGRARFRGDVRTIEHGESGDAGRARFCDEEFTLRRGGRWHRLCRKTSMLTVCVCVAGAAGTCRLCFADPLGSVSVG